MKLRFAFILTAILLSSCQPILMKLYGIKKPKIESEKSIKEKALNFKLDTSNIVSVNSADFLKVLGGQNIPDASIFDKHGKYIEYRASDSSCNAGLFQFIPALNLYEKYHQPDSSNLNEEINQFRDLNGNKLTHIDSADFYLLIYWATWTGKLNKDHVKIWEDMAKENKNARIKVYKVNLDIQSYWEKSEQEKYLKAMNSKY